MCARCKPVVSGSHIAVCAVVPEPDARSITAIESVDVEIRLVHAGGDVFTSADTVIAGPEVAGNATSLTTGGDVSAPGGGVVVAWASGLLSESG